MFSKLFSGLALAAGLTATTLIVSAPTVGHADDAAIRITEPFARVASSAARSGAAFMILENPNASDDRLVGVRSDVAERVELHTHLASGDGIMRMVEVPEGFIVPAQGAHALARGGDHVMFLGLTRPLQDGDQIALTLIFEKAGEISLMVPVAADGSVGAAPAAHGGAMGHGHDHAMPHGSAVGTQN